MAHIAYLGNFSLDFCTEVHIKKTLEKLGHTVIPLQENEVTLQQVVTTANSCDLFWWTRTYNYAKFDQWEMLRQLRVPSVSFHIDLYFGISREMDIANDPFWHTDHVFQVDGNHLEDFKALGINAYWLPPAVFAEECSLETKPMQRELVFVGSYDGYHKEWPWRQELVSHLRSEFPQTEFYPRGEAIRGAQLNELYQSTKVAVGDSLNPSGNKTYTSDRIFETTGRGGFILYPRIEFLESIFPRDVFYDRGDWQGLREKILYYLSHEEERESLRKKCYEITSQNHTYDQRLQQIFEVINAKA